MALQSGFYLIGACCQLSVPGHGTLQFVVHVYLCSLCRTGDVQRGQYRAQCDFLHALAVAQYHLTGLWCIAESFHTVGMTTLAQTQTDRAILHILQFVVDVDGTVSWLHVHHQIAHAVVYLLSYLWHQQGQLIDSFWLNATYAVVAEVDAQRHKVGVFDA